MSSALCDMHDDLTMFDVLVWGTTIADKNVRHLYNDIRKELPDLVIYDRTPLFPKFMIEYFVQEMRREKLKMFKIVRYDTCLHIDYPRDYPNKFEEKILEFNSYTKMFANILVYLYLKRSYMIKVNFKIHILLLNLLLYEKKILSNPLSIRKT